MAVLGLAEDLSDLKTQIGRIVLAEDADGDPVTPDDLGVTGAAAALLRDAFRPNLVQTIEGVPALVHGGPFANIAHGTNTLVADRVGASLADYLVTEAGFGADLGAEKFAHIVAREGIVPDVAVVVATVRGAKRHGLEMWPADFDALAKTDPEAVRAGVDNVTRHVEDRGIARDPRVVGINVFPDDAESELAAPRVDADRRGDSRRALDRLPRRRRGAMPLAELVRERAGTGEFAPLYDLDAPLREGRDRRPRGVRRRRRRVRRRRRRGHRPRRGVGVRRPPRLRLEDAVLLLGRRLADGRSGGWTLTVREVSPSAGAGFVVVKTADVMTMPGLPPSRPPKKLTWTQTGT